MYLDLSMNKYQECIILTQGVDFEHDELHYTLYVMNMKIMLKMNLQNTYTLSL